MNSERIKKMESVVLEIIADNFLEQIKEIESDFGLINITKVKISPDLSYLDISVSSLTNKENLTKTLATHAHQLQRIINKKLSIRKLPRIRFRYDESWEITQNVTNTINNLSQK